MHPKEEVFQKAKQIILNQVFATDEFQILAIKFKEKWNSNLVNGDIYEYTQMTNPMRLRLVFRAAEDLNNLPKLWSEKQELVSNLFKTILQKANPELYLKCSLLTLEVDYFIFDELAFQECVNQIDTGIVRFEFKEYQIWKIEQFWKYFTVFYKTNEEVKKNEELGINERIKIRFQEEAKKNDPFLVLKFKFVSVNFDSKENYERAGGGYNYYR